MRSAAAVGRPAEFDQGAQHRRFRSEEIIGRGQAQPGAAGQIGHGEGPLVVFEDQFARGPDQSPAALFNALLPLSEHRGRGILGIGGERFGMGQHIRDRQVNCTGP